MSKSDKRRMRRSADKWHKKENAYWRGLCAQIDKMSLLIRTYGSSKQS